MSEFQAGVAVGELKAQIASQQQQIAAIAQQCNERFRELEALQERLGKEIADIWKRIGQLPTGLPTGDEHG